MDNLLSIARAGQVKKFAADSIIFNEGDPGREMYIILSGKVDIFVNTIEGYPLSVAQMASGNFFGEMSLLEELPRSASARVLEDCCLLVIDKDNFGKVIQENPVLAIRIMKTLSSRIRSLDEKIKNIESQNREKTTTGHEQQMTENIDHIDRTDHAEDSGGENKPSTILQGDLDQQEGIGAAEGQKGIIFLAENELYPVGHRDPDLIALATDGQYLFDKEETCPLCSQKVNLKIQRMSKLRLKRVEKDFRQVFYDFEPLWYMIAVCPHCFYANFSNEFSRIDGKAALRMKDKVDFIKDKEKARFSNPRRMSEVFASYYLALKLLEAASAGSEKKAKLYLWLSWLYQDIGNETMFVNASVEALNHYLKMYYQSTKNYSDAQIQKLDILIGELMLKTGDTQEALKHFYRAVQSKANRGIADNARDRIKEIKG